MADQPSPEIPLARVQVLSDVVFASCMTVMVMNIDLPNPDMIADDADVKAFLREQLPRFGQYGVTFLLIAVYWFKHLEHFSYYRKTNGAHLWLCAFYLMFLVAIPFTNDFASTLPGYTRTQVLYSVNMLGLGLFSFFSWTYATRNNQLVDPTLSPQLVQSVRREALTEPVVAGGSIAAAFVHPVLWDLSFLLIPLLFTLRKRLRGPDAA